MEFHSPTTLDEALALLAADGARPLAGGQSLVALMNLELAAPQRLVSLRRVAGLRGITTLPDGSIRIGAMTSHAELAAIDPTAAGPRLLAMTARVVAYPAVRNFGTIGGAVAHADPAADYPVALVAADARIEIASGAGRREVTAADFFRGFFETACASGELVTAIVIPPGPAGAGAHYEKLSLVAGDFAIVSVAAIVGTTAGRCTDASVAAGVSASRPLRVAAVDSALAGSSLDDAALRAAGASLAAACAPADDQRASATYRRRVVPALVRRAIEGAVNQRRGVPA